MLVFNFEEMWRLLVAMGGSDSKGGQFLIWFNRTFTLVYVEDFR